MKKKKYKVKNGNEWRIETIEIYTDGVLLSREFHGRAPKHLVKRASRSYCSVYVYLFHSLHYFMWRHTYNPFFRNSDDAGKLNKFFSSIFAFYGSVFFIFVFLLQVALCLIIRLYVYVVAQGGRIYSLLCSYMHGYRHSLTYGFIITKK